MKNFFPALCLIVLSLSLYACKESEEDRRQKAIDLMSTQTLGLAYLEELKLDEAEEQFLKYIELKPDDKVGYANLGLVYLRMGKYAEAQGQLEKARSLDQSDPDVSLLLATVYRVQGERKKSIALLEETLISSPDHPKVLYDLSEMYASETDPKLIEKRKDYLLRLTQKQPENLVPHILLIDVYIRSGQADPALAELEKLPALFPEFPAESMEYFDQTVNLLEAADTDNALRTFTIFHNFQKVTYPYQAGMSELKGPGESSLGVPLITYSQPVGGQETSGESILEFIKFTEVAASAGLNVLPDVESDSPVSPSIIHSPGDFDGDGDMDLYMGAYDPATGKFRPYLFQNELGRYKEVTDEIGVKHSRTESDALFADFDNDGFLDLMIISQEGGILYHNAEKGRFDDVSESSGLDEVEGGKVVFADLDHDGDLDLLRVGQGQNQVYRNNGDRTFAEMAENMGLRGPSGSEYDDVLFGDFDEDGDLDLFYIGEDSGMTLFLNERHGKFKDGTNEAGLQTEMRISAADVGDFNNDGYLDLVVARKGESSLGLFLNSGKGTFSEVEDQTAASAGKLSSAEVKDLTLLDFDNDGKLDILVVGISKQEGGRGIFLFHNKGNGQFDDLTRLLPEQPSSAERISLFDYNEDGDTDLLLSGGTQPGIFLLRNDGGNMNHYLDMKLVGLRTGSAKNNFFGIGSKVEMRAGDLYQSMVVTRPEISFGLGHRSKADVIRITWTNGVPQNILLPDADQALIEEQTLKGSCPFLYAWNGERYEFVKDITWRSALGMPLGIMGENTRYAFAEASDDYIKIPGDQLKPKDGEYSIQITSELWETIYMDRVRLVAVDHPISTEVFVPEQFTPPPFPGLDLYQIRERTYPVHAMTGKGLEVLDLLSSKDDRYVSQFRKGKFQGLAESHELIIDPGQNVDTNNLVLFLSGWIFPTDASINTALSQSANLELKPPVLQVIDRNGDWKTLDVPMSFPMGKDKTVIVDLSGMIQSQDRRIRIKTNMEIYWDEAFFGAKETGLPLVTSYLEPSSSDLHYRGFSRSFRKGGRHGPHWFDYSNFSKTSKWKDLTGNYTRFGEVTELLTSSDNRYVISNAGDEMSVSFDAGDLPDLKPGYRRDFFIHSVGWVKDGDMNTASGNTVEPLPYHGMKQYPPEVDDDFFEQKELKEYREKYNTRRVDGSGSSL